MCANSYMKTIEKQEKYEIVKFGMTRPVENCSESQKILNTFLCGNKLFEKFHKRKKEFDQHQNNQKQDKSIWTVRKVKKVKILTTEVDFQQENIRKIRNVIDSEYQNGKRRKVGKFRKPNIVAKNLYEEKVTSNVRMADDVMKFVNNRKSQSAYLKLVKKFRLKTIRKRGKVRLFDIGTQRTMGEVHAKSKKPNCLPLLKKLCLQNPKEHVKLHFSRSDCSESREKPRPENSTAANIPVDNSALGQFHRILI